MNQSPLLTTQRELQGDALTLSGYRDSTIQLPAYYAARAGRTAAMKAEYEAVTSPESIAISDRSWRTAIELTGRDRQTFLQGMVSNDVVALTEGRGCRAELLNTTAHILADLYVYCLSDSLFIAMDARTTATACETLDKYLIGEKVQIVNATGKWAVIGVTGGRAAAAVAHVAQLEVGALPSTPFGCLQADSFPEGVCASERSPLDEGRRSARITRYGRRGDAGYEIWSPATDAGTIWKSLVEYGSVPVGEEAMETARIAAADPAWGSELEPSILLPETELREAMSYTKGCYVGQEIVARIRARGHTNKSLRQIRFEPGDHTMQPGDPIFPDLDDLPEGKECGRLTSVATVPVDGAVVALAYVRRDHAAHGTAVVCRYAHREAYGVMVAPNVDA